MESLKNMNKIDKFYSMWYQVSALQIINLKFCGTEYQIYFSKLTDPPFLFMNHPFYRSTLFTDKLSDPTLFVILKFLLPHPF